MKPHRIKNGILLGISLGFRLSAPECLAAPSVQIHVELNPGGSFTAQSQTLQGKIQRLPGKNRYQATSITLPLSSLKTGIDLRDEHMKAKYFEIKKFPSAAVVSNGKAQDGQFSATLTLHGVTFPISGTYTTRGEGTPQEEITGKFRCKLSEFKIPQAQYMGVGVEDEVQVEVTLPVTPLASLSTR